MFQAGTKKSKGNRIKVKNNVPSADQHPLKSFPGTAIQLLSFTSHWPLLSEGETRKCTSVSVLLAQICFLEKKGMWILGRQHTHTHTQHSFCLDTYVDGTADR